MIELALVKGFVGGLKALVVWSPPPFVSPPPQRLAHPRIRNGPANEHAPFSRCLASLDTPCATLYSWQHPDFLRASAAARCRDH